MNVEEKEIENIMCIEERKRRIRRRMRRKGMGEKKVK